MTDNDNWRIYRWHCENCGNVVQGYKGKDGKVKVVCPKCRAELKQTQKNRRTYIYELTVPKESAYW